MNIIKKRALLIILPVLILILLVIFISIFSGGGKASNGSESTFSLPKPKTDSSNSLEKLLSQRRSFRGFDAKDEISLEALSQVLWAAQGLTSPDGKRTAPSAGAIYPLELYILVERVKGISPGIYTFNPREQNLVRKRDTSSSSELRQMSFGQSFIERAAANIVFVANYESIVSRYGERGRKYTHIEVGHSAQNVYLQCESLGLGTVAVGAFDPERVGRLLELPDGRRALYIMPIGVKSTR